MPTDIVRRDWAGPDDLPSLVRLIQRTWSPRSRWHIGDIAWDIGLAPGGRPDWRMALWERGDEVLAWGWLHLPDRLSVAVNHAHIELLDAVVDWADAVVGHRVAVTVLSTETEQIDSLVRRGYAPDLGGHFFVAHHRSLDELPAIPTLPDGFTVRPVDGDAEVPARAALHREVWSSPDVTDDVFRAMTRRWPYDFAFDWVAVAPDGRLVSSVLGWYDPVHRVGEFEPVGTLTGMRRMGLSRTIGIAVMHAFRDAGGQRALVYARGDDDYPVPRQVYQALGFAPGGRTVTYRPA
jgi:hypothetical protein